jgi:hypothetical protein
LRFLPRLLIENQGKFIGFSKYEIKEFRITGNTTHINLSYILELIDALNSSCRGFRFFG